MPDPLLITNHLGHDCTRLSSFLNGSLRGKNSSTLMANIHSTITGGSRATNFFSPEHSVVPGGVQAMFSSSKPFAHRYRITINWWPSLMQCSSSESNTLIGIFTFDWQGRQRTNPSFTHFIQKNPTKRLNTPCWKYCMCNFSFLSGLDAGTEHALFTTWNWQHVGCSANHYDLTNGMLQTQKTSNN